MGDVLWAWWWCAVGRIAGVLWVGWLVYYGQDGCCTMGKMVVYYRQDGWGTMGKMVVYYWQDGWCTIGRMVVYYHQEGWCTICRMAGVLSAGWWCTICRKGGAVLMFSHLMKVNGYLKITQRLCPMTRNLVIVFIWLKLQEIVPCSICMKLNRVNHQECILMVRTFFFSLFLLAP